MKNTPEPLKYDLPPAYLAPRGRVIPEVLARLECRMRLLDAGGHVTTAVREGFIAGLYAAAAAIGAERAHSREIAEAAQRLETQG